MYSMGSSRVRMCFCSRWLIRSRMAARVVDFPEPVSPVMRMLARVLAVFCISVHSRCIGALLKTSCSSSGMVSFSRRMAADQAPCCRKRLTRQRTPAMVTAKSASPTTSAFRKSAPASSLARAEQSSSARGTGSISRMLPSTR